ncbi:MAG: hypothetical protein M1816_001176 [Peltula sp. TS41687]|nr:MAG: hypothetical protein M1816_001176 [Peltula sp. TS41687]
MNKFVASLLLVAISLSDCSDHNRTCLESESGVCKPNDFRHYFVCASGYWQLMDSGSYTCLNGEVKPQNATRPSGNIALVTLGSPRPQAWPTVPTSMDTHTLRDKHLVTYINTRSPWTIPDANETGHYNVINLAFYTTTGPADFAQAWQDLSEEVQKSKMKRYHVAGKKLMVSAFGDGDQPTTRNQSALVMADKLSDFVRSTGLDGVDIDYEDTACFNNNPDTCVDWLTQLVDRLYKKLDTGIITMSPLAPWFSDVKYKRAFVNLQKRLGYQISWYNIQYYNEPNKYTDCHSLLRETSPRSDITSRTSVQALIDAGVNPSKIVIGKPATRADATYGYMDDNELAKCLKNFPTAKELGGLMKWQYKSDPSGKAIWSAAQGFR